MVSNLQKERYSYILIQLSCPFDLYCVQNVVDYSAWQKEENVKLHIKTREENKATQARCSSHNRDLSDQNIYIVMQFRQAVN